MNNTVSGFFGGGGFGVGFPGTTVCVTVEVGGLSMPRSRRTASRLAYFLASCGSTGSMYLCVLGAVSRGGFVRGVGLGTLTLVTVITPDLGAGEGVEADAEDVGDTDGIEEGGDAVVVVVDELDEPDLLEELEEPTGEGVGVVRDVLDRKAGVVIIGNAGLVTEGREAGGGGLAETVRGGKIVE